VRIRPRLALTLVLVAIPLVLSAQWLRTDIERRAAVASLADFARDRMAMGGRERCESAPATFRDPPLERAEAVQSRSDARKHAIRTETRAMRSETRASPTENGSPLILRDESRGNVRDESQGLAREESSELAREELRGPHTADDDASPQLATARVDEHGEHARRGLDVERRGESAHDAGTPRVEMFAYAPDFTSANRDAPAFPNELRRALESGTRESGTLVETDTRRDVTAAVRMPWSAGPCAIVLATQRAERPAVLGLDEVGFGALIAGALVIAVFIAVGPLERRFRRLIAGVRRSAADRYREPVTVEGRDEIGELASAFNAAGSEVRTYIEELEKRERSLRDFVQNTTHDVMLPLTVLQGHLTQIRDLVAEGAVPSRTTVRDALEESHYLASLVQNLVAAARLESGRPDPRHDEFSWNQVVERVVQRHGPIASAREIELDFAAPEQDVRAEGDVTLVEQALSNVVHNAVRYNQPGGHVAILLEARGGQFSVRVFDDGPGVSEAELACIVDRSFRGDAARARHPEGTGLGLAIAKDVADRHGFALELRRAEAGGLEVEFRGRALAA